MKSLIASLSKSARLSPKNIALQSYEFSMTYGELSQNIFDIALMLKKLDCKRIGIFADNSIDWVLVDLSAILLEILIVPIPLFFSGEQIKHIVRDVGLDILVTDVPEYIQPILWEDKISCSRNSVFRKLHILQLSGITQVNLDSSINKVTYTSGTTGNPKGVCLSNPSIEQVVASLIVLSEATSTDCHLCVTPLSTLLENIAGIYVPLMVGASISIPTLKEVGLAGAIEFDAKKMLSAVNRYKATTQILAPQMLQAMIVAISQGFTIPKSLRFIAVGGAPLPIQLLDQATYFGIPVFQGYGLSECASVVTLNSLQENTIGSVGKPLPHTQLFIAEDGEILINNPAFSCYIGSEGHATPWATGDIGYLNHEGYLFITGRKKTMFITSFGRNIEPEWVESTLTLQSEILQAAIFGEGKPFNVAVIYPKTGCSKEAVFQTIQHTNQTLPDYARISKWVIAQEPFDIKNNQLTPNGRLKRTVIESDYKEQIELLYKEELHVVI